jgi:hypothetical protein
MTSCPLPLLARLIDATASRTRSASPWLNEFLLKATVMERLSPSSKFDSMEDVLPHCSTRQLVSEWIAIETADCDQIVRLIAPAVVVILWIQISPCIRSWDRMDPLQNNMTQLFITSHWSMQTKQMKKRKAHTPLRVAGLTNRRPKLWSPSRSCVSQRARKVKKKAIPRGIEPKIAGLPDSSSYQ